MTPRTRGVLLAGLATLAVLSGAAVVAWGSVFDGQGVIRACYVNASGMLRIVDSDAAECRRGESPIAWNVQGPPGLAGERGLPGQTGQPGPGLAGFTTSFGPIPVPTANTSTRELLILGGLPNGPSFASASLNIRNGSGRPVTLICSLGEFGGAYAFDVPASMGFNPYQSNATLLGGANAIGVPFGCHIWGDPAHPVENVTVSGTIEAIALSSLTVQP